MLPLMIITANHFEQRSKSGGGGGQEKEEGKGPDLKQILLGPPFTGGKILHSDFIKHQYFWLIYPYFWLPLPPRVSTDLSLVKAVLIQLLKLLQTFLHSAAVSHIHI